MPKKSSKHKVKTKRYSNRKNEPKDQFFSEGKAISSDNDTQIDDQVSRYRKDSLKI